MTTEIEVEMLKYTDDIMPPRTDYLAEYTRRIEQLEEALHQQLQQNSRLLELVDMLEKELTKGSIGDIK